MWNTTFTHKVAGCFQFNDKLITCLALFIKIKEKYKIEREGESKRKALYDSAWQSTSTIKKF